VSISSTFSAQIFRTNFPYEHCFDSFFHLHVTREKLPKQCLYKKFVWKMLMKLTLAVNFINIFCAFFSYARRFGSFFLVTCTLHVHRKSCWNNVCTKNSYVKCWWNWLQVSSRRVLQHSRALPTDSNKIFQHLIKTFYHLPGTVLWQRRCKKLSQKLIQSF